MARKPLSGTVAGNVLAYGTGALNIDACRIGNTVETWPKSRAWGAGYVPGADRAADRTEATGDVPPGRWPPNVVLDVEAARMLDEQTGEMRDGKHVGRNRDPEAHSGNAIYGARNADARDVGYGGSGGASRFFYCAKASSAERNAGLPDLRMDREQERRTARNVHPTVKPVELMRWLIRLVTPPGGVVLDPFLGSGTTGCAAVLERVEFIGVERDAEYLPIAEARIRWWAEHPEGVELVKRLEAERERAAVVESGQDALF